MRFYRTLLPLALVGLVSGCSVETKDGGLNFLLGSRSGEEFRWQGEIPAGQAVEIKDVNGRIRADRATGDRVEVTATRTARRSDPDEVRIEVVEHGGGVTICAVYPSVPGEPENECVPGEGGRMRVRNSDVSVAFTVAVPAGVSLIARTVNGSVEAADLDSDVTARAVNGSLRIATARHATAQTVNGSIRASLGRADWTEAAEFRTVNGSITLEVPADLHADILVETTNGRITTDFELADTREMSRRRVSGRVGQGGRELSLRSVNGSIRLRKLSGDS
jgi:hypothetical protein